MKLTMYQIDAFANKLFEGNPAAICPLQSWISDELMQLIAMENNLSETAFFVPIEQGYQIRWFTPEAEVALCGHATLASAYVIFNYLGFKQDLINFQSKSGLLTVERSNDLLVMDFPSQPPLSCTTPEQIIRAFKISPVECLKAEDYIVVFANEDDVVSAQPDLNALMELDLRGVAITAKSDNYDFVSRFFAPKVGINEDPVTGSSFTQLIPYWSKKLQLGKMHARQISRRGGEVNCELLGDRVKISGKAVTYLLGEIEIADNSGT